MSQAVVEECVQSMPTPFLKEISRKIREHKRLNEEEGLELLKLTNEEEIQAVGKLADWVRKEKVGDIVHFASTLYIHPTNLCELNCPFCSFYAKPGWEKAWFLTPEQIEQKIARFLPGELTEIHIVGGLWKECDLPYYQDLFTRIKRLNPNYHIKALTAVEYDFLAKLHNISVEEVFLRMMEWGLGSLPGGGAEVLDEEIRGKIAPGKITSDEFLNIHRIAHSLGLSSNITMLFDHIETPQHLINHISKVRELQDITGGFKTFIPLKFGEEGNALGKRKNRLIKKNIPLVYAVSRLMLDNIKHIKVLWNYLGVDEALEILHWGGNDLSSTNQEEKIITMAGGVKIKMDEATMNQLILSQNRIPKLLHTGEI